AMREPGGQRVSVRTQVERAPAMREPGGQRVSVRTQVERAPARREPGGQRASVRTQVERAIDRLQPGRQFLLWLVRFAHKETCAAKPFGNLLWAFRINQHPPSHIGVLGPSENAFAK